MTEAQAALADQVTGVLAGDERIRSVWLYGSLGRGLGDAWSDVDLVAEVGETDRAACLADYHHGRPGLPELVLAQEIHGLILAAITTDWERFDISFLTASELARIDSAALKPLLGDPDAQPSPHPPEPDLHASARLVTLVNEFLRVLGLLPVAIGRGEWLLAQQGGDLLRKMLIELMIEENRVPPAARGGVKRLNAFLTAEQRGLLEALDPPPARREPLIAASRDLARLFMARARPLAQQLGATWPRVFEQATRRHLQRSLAFDF